MKIVHCLGWYFPDALGGTEVYVQGLARAQRALGHSVTVMAARDGDSEERYSHDAIEVIRYPVPAERSAESTRGLSPHASFPRFVAALSALAPDVFHMHSLTYGCNLHHLRAARARSARAFVTTHVPGFVCLRGTMMRMGREACDGRVTPEHCTPCLLQARGVPEGLARLLGVGLSRLPDTRALVSGRVGTALGLASQVRDHAGKLRALEAEADAVIVVCEWLQRALVDNGIAKSRLELIRQGVDCDQVAREKHTRRRAARPPGPLRIGFFGRSSPVKGLAVLLEALGRVPAVVEVELDAYVQSNPGAETTELERLRVPAARDSRVRMHPALAPQEIQRAMAEHDVIAIPSLGLETGPLVALEALAVGVPVLGSDLGGLRELIEPGKTGWLEPAGDVAHWAARIEALARGERALHSEAATVRVQSVREMAERVSALYERALHERS